MTQIVEIFGRQILDSRGNPTVEVDVTLSDGSFGRPRYPAAPARAFTKPGSCGTATKSVFLGKGVTQGGRERQFEHCRRVDRHGCAWTRLTSTSAMIELDGTPNKKNLGANAILGVSMAIAHAAAQYYRTTAVPLSGRSGRRLCRLR